MDRSRHVYRKRGLGNAIGSRPGNPEYRNPPWRAEILGWNFEMHQWNSTLQETDSSLGARMNPQFAEYFFDMAVDRPGADAQLVGNFLVQKALA